VTEKEAKLGIHTSHNLKSFTLYMLESLRVLSPGSLVRSHPSVRRSFQSAFPAPYILHIQSHCSSALQLSCRYLESCSDNQFTHSLMVKHCNVTTFSMPSLIHHSRSPTPPLKPKADETPAGWSFTRRP
ncbi:hypothetical protein AMECASPLE_037954, partial [Ameca splendens]